MWVVVGRRLYLPAVSLAVYQRGGESPGQRAYTHLVYDQGYRKRPMTFPGQGAPSTLPGMDYIPGPSSHDLPDHLMEGHGYTLRYVSYTANAKLRTEHDQSHEDATAKHLEHTHVHQAPLPPQTPEDEMENNILVTGAVVVALMGQPALEPVEVVMVDGCATNQIRIYPDWMMSGYKVTVERIPEEPS